MMARLSKEMMIKAIEDSYSDDISNLGSIGLPGSCLRVEPDMIIYSSGLPINTFNGIMRPKLSTVDLPRRVEFAMSYFKRARLPMCWVLGPSSGPTELEEFLTSMGLVLELIYSGMALDLLDLKNEPLPAGLNMLPVRNKKALKEFISVSEQAFEIPEEVRDGWGQLIDRLWAQPNIYGFLGVLNGRPVSTSVVALHEDVASIYMVGTLKEARGKGIGGATSREALSFAKKAGRGIAVLEATEMGIPVYERIGFSKICEFRFLTWAP